MPRFATTPRAPPAPGKLAIRAVLIIAEAPSLALIGAGSAIEFECVLGFAGTTVADASKGGLPSLSVTSVIYDNTSRIASE